MFTLNPRFLLDGMLGSLASWLRICGYDSIYHVDMKDEDLLLEAKKENRILLTRDKQLFERSKKYDVSSFYVKGNNPTEKLGYLCKNIGISLIPCSSRCSQCNSPIKTINKEKIIGLIPEKSFTHYNQFWICESCGKIFWKGSHWNKILKTLSIAKKECEQNL